MLNNYIPTRIACLDQEGFALNLIEQLILDKQVPISFLAQNNSRLHIYPQMFTLIQNEMLTQIEPPLTSKLGFGLWFWLP